MCGSMSGLEDAVQACMQINAQAISLTPTSPVEGKQTNGSNRYLLNLDGDSK